MKSTIDITAIQTYAKVVQTGSFTRAAEALDTHKAYVSRVVSQLERELGARLLERSTRALSMTEVGREFYERVTLILAAVEDAKQAVVQTQDVPRGTLKLTCSVEFGMLAVGRWVNQYLEQYPQMKVHAEMTGRIVDVVHEGFDLAIRVGELPDSTLTARLLGHLKYALYVSKAYLKGKVAPHQPEDLVGHDLLAFAALGRQHHWQLLRRGETRRVALNARFRSTSFFTIRDAAAAGLGIAVLPRWIGDPLVADRKLLRILKDWHPPDVPVHAVFASTRFLAPKVRAFVDLACEAMQGADGR